MKKITKAATLVLYILLLLAVIFTALTLFGGDVPGATLRTPVYTDSILQFSYGLIALGVVLIIVFEIINLILHPANAKRALFSVVVTAVIVAIGYALSDGTPLQILGYEGTDNVPSMLIVTDTGLFAFYILLGALVLAIIGSEVSRLFK